MLTKPGISKLVSTLFTVISSSLEKLSENVRHTHNGNVVRSTSSAFCPQTRFALLPLIVCPTSMSDSKVKHKSTQKKAQRRAIYPIGGMLGVGENAEIQEKGPR